MNKKKISTLIMIILVVVALIIGSGITYYIARVTEKDCKKCEKCSANNKECTNNVNTEKTSLWENYFNMNDTQGANNTYTRANYILNDWFEKSNVVGEKAATDFEAQYNNFITKLQTEYGSTSSYVKKNTTFSIDDPYDDVYVALKTDGTYKWRINMCEGYSTGNGTYKIYNNELALLKTADNNYEIMFYYQLENILQSVTLKDCNSIQDGAILKE